MSDLDAQYSLERGILGWGTPAPERCRNCPVAAADTCYFGGACDRMSDPEFRQRALAFLDLQRAMQNQTYPSIAEQALNASKAAGRAVAATAAGRRVMVDRQEQDRRLAICRSCEFFDSLHRRCRKCGCFASAKNWLATERCPIGKWG